MNDVASELRCPACAAPVEPPPGDVLRCPYCGTKSRIGKLASARGVASAAVATPRTGTSAMFVTVMVAMVALGGAAYFLLLSGGSQDVAASPAPLAVAQPVAPAPPPVVEPPEPAPPVAPEPSPMDDMFSKAPAEDAVAVRWTAKVTKANGRSKKGVKCEIDGHTDGDSVRPLEVRCKGDLLFTSTQKFSGMANMSTGTTVVTAKDGSPRWLLRYNDTGSRSMRPQIRLDSAARVGRIWSDELPPWDVDLAIDPEGKRTDGAK